MASPNSMLTQTELKRLFTYDTETGLFCRRLCSDRSHIGDSPVGLCSWGYINFRVRGPRYRAHILAWLYVYGVWPTHQIDHINGIKTDNRIANLRDVPQSLNQHNRPHPRIDNQLGVLGVYARGSRFRACILVDGKTKNLGTFATVHEASEAYLEAKRVHHPGYLG